MKTKWILVGSAAVLAGIAVLAAVRARAQPTRPATRTTVAVVNEKTAPASKPIESVDLITIVQLETRDNLVAVQSGARGLVYRVETKDGQVLYENLSEEQLKAQAPEIHELIKTAVAGSGAKDGSFLDARVGR